MPIKASEKGLDFIRGQEKFKSQAYNDPYAKVKTIGYGDTEGDTSKPITLEEAESRLKNRVGVAEQELSRHITRQGLTQNQQDVLVDMHYNLGLDHMSGFIDTVNRGTHEEIQGAIRQYVKATDPDTGKKVEVPALVKRANDRANLWGTVDGESGIPSSNEDLLGGLRDKNEDLLAGIDNKENLEKNYDLLADIDEYEKDHSFMAENASSEMLRRQVESAADASDPEVKMKNDMARNLAERTGMTFDEAQARLSEFTPEQILEEHGRETVIRFFPGVARFMGADPDNYAMIRDNVDWAKKAEIAAKPLKPDNRSDIEKMAANQLLHGKRAYLHWKMLASDVSTNEGKRLLADIDDELAKNAYSEALQHGQKKIATAWDKFDWSGEKSLNLINEIFKYPKDFSMTAFESIGTSLGAMGAGAVGGMAAGPAGAFATAGTFAGIMSFGEYMDNQLAQFADPQTGAIDYDKAFSDPQRVRQWRQEAGIYASVMGLAEALYTKVAGKFLLAEVKGVAKEAGKKSVVKTLAKVGKGLVKEQAVEAGQETLGQYAATSAADLYAGRLTKEKNKANMKEALQEGAYAIVPGAALGTMGAGGRYVWQNRKNAADVTLDVTKKSFKAINDTVKLATLRKVKDEANVSKENPQQTEDFIQTIMNPFPQQEDVDGAPIDHTPENNIESEERDIDREATTDVIHVSPAEFIKYHELNGKDHLETLLKFSPLIQQEFARNKDTDSSIAIPQSQWLRAIEDDPSIDGIARINGNDLNSVEANEALEELHKKPFALYDMVAFHGSPRDFDKFSNDKIGTGEGAQAFGHGLYFTEDQDIAEYYRKKLAFKEFYNSGDEVPGDVDQALEQLDYLGFGDPWTAIMEIRKAGKKWQSVWDADNPEDQEAAAKISDFVFNAKGMGQTFEVALDAEKDHMLDWNLPYSKQSEYVKKALLIALNAGQVEDYLTGEQVYEALKDAAYKEFPEDSTRPSMDVLPARASDVLKKAGIPGIKYKAERGKSDKHNFVVFDDSKVKVNKKFYEEMDSRTDVARPTDSDEGIEIVEPDSAEGNIISRPIYLTTSHRSETDKKIFQSIKSRLMKSNGRFDEAMLEHFADMEYRHLVNRAEMLGQTVDQVAERLQIGKATKTESNRAHGIFKPNQTPGGKYTIVFAPTANAKTVVHEFGHSWLHEMSEDWTYINSIPEDKLTIQQAEYKKAMITAAELLSLSDMSELYNRDWEDTTRDGKVVAGVRQIHEVFAQTAERYFFEGKFENSRIRALMESFRKWFVQVAHTIGMTYADRGWGWLKITPDVERMFESILGVSNKVEEEVIPMFPIPLFDPDMLGEEGKKYKEAIANARSEAIASAYHKAWNQTIKEQQKKIDAEYNRIYQESADEIDARPSMQVRAAMEEAYKEFQNDPNGEMPDPRLSFESVQKILMAGDEARTAELKKSIPGYMMTGKKKGGMPVELFMQMRGIQTPEQLLEMLVESGLRDELIEHTVNSKIDQSFPVMKSDEEIHKIAEAAVNSAGKEKLLLAEVKILMTKYVGDFKGMVEKMINPPSYLKDTSKINMMIHAQGIVANSNAEKFSAEKFLRDSHRMGRESARRFRTNNYEEALDFKLKEAIQFFAYRQAKEAQKLMANTRALQKAITKYAMSKDVANDYDADVMAFAKQTIQRVAAGQDAPEFNTHGFSEWSGISEDDIMDINRQISNFALVTPGRNGAEISVAKYIAYGELLGTLLKTARAAKVVELGGRKAGYKAVAVQIQKDILKKDNVVQFSKYVKGTNLRRSFTTTRTLFESLYDSTEDFSKSYLGRLYHTITDAEATRNIEFSRHNDRMVKAVRTAVQNDPGMKRILYPILNRVPYSTYIFGALDKSSRPIVVKMGDKNFTFNNRGELHMANLLVMGSESGAKKFLIGTAGFGINPETGEFGLSEYKAMIDGLIADGTLTKKDFDMYQEIWSIFEEIHPQVKSALRRSNGFNMGKIEGSGFTLFGTQYTGGYVPLASRDGLVKPGKINSMLDPETDGFRHTDLYPGMNTGMSNERDASYYPVDLDMSRLGLYLSATMNIAHLRNPLLDFGRIIASPEVSSALEQRRPGAIGDERSGIVVRWFNAVKGQTYTDYSDDELNRLAKMLRQRVNLSLYLGNLMSPAKQILGLLPAMTKVGPRRLLAASAQHLLAPRTVRAQIKAESKVMEARLRDSQEAMIRSWDELDTNFDWISWTDDKVRKIQYFMIQLSQNCVDVTTYMAAKEKALSMGMNESDAVHYANDVVETTQSSANVTAMANIQRGSDLKKILTMVASVPIAMNNLVAAEKMRDQSTYNKMKAITVIMLLTAVMPALLDAKLAELTDGKDDDEDKDEDEVDQEKNEILFWRTLGGSMDTAIPILGRPLSSSLMYGTASMGPAFSKLNKLATTQKAVDHISKGVDLSATEMAALMDTATIVTGIPFAPIGRLRKGQEFFMGDAEKDDFNAERREQIAASEEE